MTTTLPNRIIKYFVDTSNPSQSGFYFYEKAGTGGFVRLGALADASRAGGNTFEIDSSTAENVIYNGLGGADTYVVRSNLDKNIEISDPHTGDDGSGNEAKNTIVFDSDVTVTSINQVTRLEEAGILRIELTLDTGAVITVNGPDVFQYVVGGAAALDFAGFIATYGASGITPANRAPVIESDLFASIDENVDGSAAPVPVGQIVASDADASDSLTYSIVAVDQNGGSVTGFEIDGAGLITYVGTGLDAETITSVALTVSVSDGEESAQTSVAISVRNIDEGNARFVVTSDGDLTAAAVGDVLTVGTRSADPDGNDAFTYQWYRDGAEIADATGASYTIPEDYDGNSIYVVVRYTDGSGTNEVVTLSGILADAPVDVIAPAVAPATPAILNVADLDPATTGFSLTGERYRDFSGYEVSSVGDINGDNIDDFAIGAPAADPNGDRSGATYIIYGQTDGFSANINLRNLNAGDGFRIVGENRGDLSGGSVSSGDVNGDGFNDIIIGALQAEPDGDHINHNSGSTYVVFGKSGGYSGTVNLSSIVTNGDGFRLDGENRSDWSGEFVSAGDINGDGYDDVIIGVSWVGYNGDGGRSGSTYVVFGKPDNPDESNDLNGIMSLSELDGSDGFRIDGGGPVDWSGRFVSSGDVNGDGYDDIIIGARYVGQYDDNGDWSGTAYVVFGKANDANDSSDFDAIMRLSEIDGSNGFRIDGVNYHGLSGLSSAGDINGDGNDDIIIGFNAVARNGNWIGASYIVFGKANDASGASTFDANVRLSELDGSDGFRIEGTNADDHSGLFVSSAGDFNGDGFDDVIIGAHGAESNGVSSSSGSTYISSSGSTYIVFGKETGFSDTIRLSDLDGSDGVRIDGAHRSYNIDYSAVSSAGDVNDDGYDDVIIGASGAGPNGSSYIVYGYATSGTDADENTDTAAPANIIVKYFVDTSNPSQSGFYFYEVAGDDNLVRLDRAHEGTLGGDDTFEIDSPTAELVIYNGLGGADTYVIRGSLDNDVQIHDIDFGDDGSGNEVKNTIVFASDVTVTSIHQDRLQGRADVIKIEQTLDTDAVVTVHVPDAFEYVVGGAAALDFAEFIATYGASGISATNRAPVFENEPTDLSINENADGSAVPVSVGRVVATDADAGDTLTYSIVSTADQNGDSVTGFEVDGTGLITYVGTGLDAEAIASVALTVSASDGEDSAQTSVAISVTNIDEGNASFVVTSNRDINAAVAGDVLTVGTRSSDPDGDGTFTYQWYRDGAEIAGATDARYTITESDEGNSLYVAVSYTDGSGTNEVVTASGIIVPANTAPVFENVPTALFGENVDGTKTLVSVGRITTKDAADAVTYSIVSAVDQNGGNVTGFDVDGTGFITYIGTGIDAEIVTLVALTISARNGGGSAEAVVAVQIANFDEGNARFVVTSDGDITAAAVGDVLTIRTISADPDGNGAFAYQWYRDGAEIADATGASYTIPEDYDGNSIYVVVRYTDGSGTNEVVTLSGIIAPAPVDVIAPAVALGAGAVTSLAENADTSARTKIADIVLTDADGGSTGTLELAGNHADMFEVVGTVLYLKAGVSLDHESVDALNLRVQLTEDSTVGVGTSIAVADIDEGNASFVVTSDGYLNAAVAGDVLTVRMRSSDPDGDGTFTYQWYRDGVDIAGATGTSYTVTEGDEGNSLYVTVRYTDGSGTDETVTASGIIAPVDNDAPAIAAEYSIIEGEGTDGFFVFKTESLTDVIVSFFIDGDHVSSDMTPFVAESTNHDHVFLSMDEWSGVNDVGHRRHNSAEIMDVFNTAIDDGRITLLTSVELHPDRVASGHLFAFYEDHFGRIDINAARLSNVIAEDEDTSTRLKVADIVLTNVDGTDTLVLAGTHANMFEIDGTELYLRAGASLDHESVDTLNVRAQLNENTDIGVDISVSVVDVDEGEASYVFTSDGDINAPVVGDILTVVEETPDPDGYSSRVEIIVLRDDVGVSGIDKRYIIKEEDVGHTLKFVARYTDGSGTIHLAETPEVVAGYVPGIAVDYPIIEGEGTDGVFVFKTESQIRVRVTLTLVDISEDDVATTVNTSYGSGHHITIGIGGENGVRHDSTKVLEVINAAIDDGHIRHLTSAELHPDSAASDDFTAPVSYVRVPPARLLNAIAEDADTSARIKVADLVLTDAGDDGTLELTGTHADMLEVIGTEIYLKAGASLDHESADTLVARVQLNENPAIGVDVSVSVTNVDEGKASYVLTSNGDINAPVVGDILTVVEETPDPDGSGARNSFWLKRDDVTINRIGENYTITEEDVGHTLKVVWHYTDGGGTSRLVETPEVAVPVPAIAGPVPANRTPVFENEPTDLSINENADGSATPVSVGRVVASDADAADTLTYSIVVSTADQNGDIVTGFEVDGTGLITYVGTGLDAETITSVALTVSASDGEDSAQTSVAISVTNIDEGNASFVVTSDRDINAAVAGDVLTVALRSSDPDGDGTFTYQWYRDGVDIADATGTSYTITEADGGNSIYVAVRYTDGSGADETVTASGIIVPVPADNDDDASEDPVNITYTMTQAPTGVSLTRGGVALSVGETFTYQDVQGGWVALTVNDENALSGLRLTTDDGTDADPEGISLDIEVREVADIAAPEAGNDLDYSENEGSLVIDTGDYGDQITAAQGSDFITGGLGDDTINLDPVEGRETGQDTVVYNFGSGSVFTATDGGDDITGFKRGEDIFLLKTESDNPELATLDGLFSYVSGPNKGSSHDDLMIVRPNYEYEPDGSGGLNFFLTGIEFHFEDGGVYGNGYLAQGHVSITFDERLPWEEFLSLIEIDNGNGSIDGNFDHRRGIIRDLSTLPNLMGEGSLAYEVEAPAQTPPQDVDVPLEDDIPATSFDVV